MYFSDSLEVLDYFSLDKEILLFDSPRSFETQLEMLLDDPERGKKIAISAQNRALKDHTYSVRCRTILDLCAQN